MRTGPTNPKMQELIQELRKHGSVNKRQLWARIADDLEKPTRQRREVNLSRLNRHTQKNEVIIVPGKVLGSGMLDHSITVAAFAFSESAKARIKEVKGEHVTITELMQKYPDAKNIRIIG